MSLTLKSKAKSSPKMAKEPQKASPSGLANGRNAPAAAVATTTISVASHLVEAQLGSSQNGRPLTMVEIEGQILNSVGNKSEFDSISSNESCSGESEDQKERALPPSTTSQSEAIPGGDTDKRDKIRQKNERKHQRQKERRAQELHERCTTLLMSRKLDLLTQQFVAMGFPAERATRALILNEGRVEDSVSWLFDRGAEEEQLCDADKDGAANMKIDISEELTKMTEMEGKFKCMKQEVQRAVVTCEGDLEKAMEFLSTQQKQDLPSTQRATESSGMVPAVNRMNNIAHQSQVLTAKPTASVSVQQTRREDRDLNYSKTAVGSGLPDPRNAVALQSLKAQSKQDWMKNHGQAQVDKRWPGPLFSYSLASSSLQSVVPPKTEARHVMVSSDGSRLGLPAGSMREPIVVMQRSQSLNGKPHQSSTSFTLSMPSTVTPVWDSNIFSPADSVKIAKGGLLQRYPSMNPTTGSLQTPNSQPLLHPDRSRHLFSSSPSEVDAAGWGSGSWGSGKMPNQPAPLATTSSLGIFTGWGSSSGSSGSSSPVDWSNGGLMPQLDYTRVDWSLESTPLGHEDLRSPAPAQFHESWLNQFEGSGIRNARMLQRNSQVARFQDNHSLLSVDPLATALSPDWTSPFAGKDIFRLPRQIVTSPAP